MCAAPTVSRPRGFTLIEVLVALSIMAVLAVMAWQGVDGIARARSASEGQVNRMLRLDTALAQWEQDLTSIDDTQTVPALAFDGATLRMTRHADAGMQVIAWSLRGGTLLRWASPAVTSARELQDRWLRSLQLLGSEPEQLRVFDGIAQWQVYFYRQNGWSNAQSSDDVETVTTPASPGAPSSSASGAGATASAPSAGSTTTRTVLPSGVRVVMGFAEGSGLAGDMTRDIRLGPQTP